MIATATAIVLGGCAATTRFVVARAEPAPLAGVRRPSLAFDDAPQQPGSGARLADLLAARLRAAGLEPVLGASGEVDGSVIGGIEVLAPDAGRAVVRAKVSPLGGAAATPGVTVEGPPQAAAALLEAAAAALAAALLPTTQAVTIEWEEASPWDDAAREHMAAGRPAEALAALEDALPRAKAAVGAEALASLHYDLGLCLDLLGRTAEAERALDEALTLDGTDRHLEALRELRRRRAGGGR